MQRNLLYMWERYVCLLMETQQKVFRGLDRDNTAQQTKFSCLLVDSLVFCYEIIRSLTKECIEDFIIARVVHLSAGIVPRAYNASIQAIILGKTFQSLITTNLIGVTFNITLGCRMIHKLMSVPMRQLNKVRIARFEPKHRVLKRNQNIGI